MNNFYLYRLEPLPSGVLLPVFETCELESEEVANHQSEILSVIHHTPVFVCSSDDLPFVFSEI